MSSTINEALHDEEFTDMLINNYTAESLEMAGVNYLLSNELYMMYDSDITTNGEISYSVIIADETSYVLYTVKDYKRLDYVILVAAYKAYCLIKGGFLNESK